MQCLPRMVFVARLIAGIITAVLGGFALVAVRDSDVGGFVAFFAVFLAMMLGYAALSRALVARLGG